MIPTKNKADLFMGASKKVIIVNLLLLAILIVSCIILFKPAGVAQAQVYSDGRGCCNSEPCSNGNSVCTSGCGGGDQGGGNRGSTSPGAGGSRDDDDDDDRNGNRATPPKGSVDRITCDVVQGWACDLDTTQPIDVHIYNGTTFIGSATANRPREAAVGSQCLGNSNRGYQFTIPPALRNGVTHSISVFAIGRGPNGGPDNHNPRLGSGNIRCVPPPTVSLNASPSTAWPGQPFTLSWSSTGATSCTATDAWSGGKSVQGIESVVARTTPGVSRYTLSCQGSGGSTPRSTDVNLQTPTVTLTADRSVIRRDESTTVSWQITPDPRTNPDASCSILGIAGTPYDVTTTAANSVSTGPITNARTVTLSCDIYGITYTDQVLVEVVPTAFEI